MPYQAISGKYISCLTFRLHVWPSNQSRWMISAFFHPHYPQLRCPWARHWAPNCSCVPQQKFAHCSGCVFTTHCCVWALGWDERRGQIPSMDYHTWPTPHILQLLFVLSAHTQGGGWGVQPKWSEANRLRWTVESDRMGGVNEHSLLFYPLCCRKGLFRSRGKWMNLTRHINMSNCVQNHVKCSSRFSGWLNMTDWLFCTRLKIQELLSDLDTAHAEAVLQCVRSRFDEIRHALVDRTNGISSTQLQDFNWQLKVHQTHIYTHALIIVIRSSIDFSICWLLSYFLFSFLPSHSSWHCPVTSCQL